MGFLTTTRALLTGFGILRTLSQNSKLFRVIIQRPREPGLTQFCQEKFEDGWLECHAGDVKALRRRSSMAEQL